ncbi:MAG: biotin/lipoyl-binding protein, partial [Chloroflexi bacterium]|nr:biotin/lipoyl-binding protein [Chloroflexota bacterium]
MKLSANGNALVGRVRRVANVEWKPFKARALTVRVWHVASVVVVLLAAVVACQANAATNAAGADVWTGFLEGKTVDVSSQVSGRVTDAAVAEGDSVQQGQLLMTVDDDLAQQRKQAADADVAAAQAQWALLLAGARPEDLALAQARVDQASAALAAATQAVTDTEAIRSNPQTLLISQADAETGVQAATHTLDAAAKQAEALDGWRTFWRDQLESMQDGVTIIAPIVGVMHFDTPVQRIVDARSEQTKADNAAWQAWIAAAQANASLTLEGKTVDGVSGQLANPIALDTRVDQAHAARDEAAANLESAQAALETLREGASPAQIQAARDALDQARARRDAVDQDLEHYRITAPQAGTVQTTFYRKGEVVGAGAPLVRLSVDGNLTLRVFVPLSTLAGVRVDATAPVWVTESNNLSAQGKVTQIADNAEFTSRQAQTDSERNALLVGVEISVPSMGGSLKAGMPASASFTRAAPGPAAALPALASSPSLKYSGTLEYKQTRIAAEASAQVNAVHVSKGDVVTAGETLLELDRASIDTSVREADAAVRAAQSNLNQVMEKARPGALASADAEVAQANAALSGANAALDDADRALSARQDISTQLQMYKGKVLAAKATAEAAPATLASISTTRPCIWRSLIV